MPDANPAPLWILVAEDVAVNRELIRLFLEPLGYRVDAVCDGLAAVQAVAETDYDLVFMDMQMPGMDGMDATRAIRRLGGIYATLPIIGLSANIVPDQMRRCLDAGMSAHLSKPFTSDSLSAAIRQWTGAGAAGGNPVLSAFVRQAGWASVRGLLEMMIGQITTFEACPPEDTKALAHNCHALRGAAGALGYDDLAKVCRALEDACKFGTVPSTVVELTFKVTAITRRAIEGELARAA
jgi:CheY-like chemotaxis protein